MTVEELTDVVLETGVIGGGNSEMRRAAAQRVAEAVMRRVDAERVEMAAPAAEPPPAEIAPPIEDEPAPHVAAELVAEDVAAPHE